MLKALLHTPKGFGITKQSRYKTEDFSRRAVHTPSSQWQPLLLEPSYTGSPHQDCTAWCHLTTHRWLQWSGCKHHRRTSTGHSCDTSCPEPGWNLLRWPAEINGFHPKGLKGKCMKMIENVQETVGNHGFSYKLQGGPEFSFHQVWDERDRLCRKMSFGTFGCHQIWKNCPKIGYPKIQWSKTEISAILMTKKLIWSLEVNPCKSTVAKWCQQTLCGFESASYSSPMLAPKVQLSSLPCDVVPLVRQQRGEIRHVGFYGGTSSSAFSWQFSHLGFKLEITKCGPRLKSIIPDLLTIVWYGGSTVVW